MIFFPWNDGDIKILSFEIFFPNLNRFSQVSL